MASDTAVRSSARMRRQDCARSSSVTWTRKLLLPRRGQLVRVVRRGPEGPGEPSITIASGPSAARSGRASQNAHESSRRTLCTSVERRVHGSVRRSRPVSCVRDEADLPAQEAQARPHPRLSCAHEHPRGSHRAQAPPGQGPQAPDRLAVMAQKRRRLSRSRRVRARVPAGALEGQPLPRALRVPAREDEASADARRPAARPVGVAPRRRRGRPQPRQARAARGVLGRGRAPAGRLRLRGRRAARRARARRARGPGRDAGALAELVASWAARRRERVARSRSPRSASTCASSRRCSRGAASTCRRARRTRSTPCATTACCAASCSPAGGCCAATRGATGATTRSRTRRCSSAASLQQPVRTDADGASRSRRRCKRTSGSRREGAGAKRDHQSTSESFLSTQTCGILRARATVSSCCERLRQRPPVRRVLAGGRGEPAPEVERVHARIGDEGGAAPVQLVHARPGASSRRGATARTPAVPFRCSRGHDA